VPAFPYLRAGFKASTAPQMAAPMPPSNIHNALFVGVPLNVRERVDPAEFEASIP
jgi:hypothetical protein